MAIQVRIALDVFAKILHVRLLLWFGTASIHQVVCATIFYEFVNATVRLLRSLDIRIQQLFQRRISERCWLTRLAQCDFHDPVQEGILRRIHFDKRILDSVLQQT
jgi:hypothetical protein